MNLSIRYTAGIIPRWMLRERIEYHRAFALQPFPFIRPDRVGLELGVTAGREHRI